jgi:WD40 repeat protein
MFWMKRKFTATIQIASGQSGLLLSLRREPSRLVEMKGTGHSIHAAFSPDGTLLVTGCEDYTLLLWPLQSPTVITRQPLPEAISVLAWPSDGTLLAVAAGIRVIFWQLAWS